MAFDGVVMHAVVSELSSCLIGGKVNKIFEPNKNEILLGIYSYGKNYALNISIDSTNYRINLTTHSKPNPQNVLNFCMVLRKHLVGGIIKNIYSNGFERIVFVDIECHNELNDIITKTLVIELMGRHSNVILLNETGTIIDSLRHINKFDNATRNIFPGVKYENISSSKLDFSSSTTFDNFYQAIFHKELSLPSAISNCYNGFGKKNFQYLLDYLNIADADFQVSTAKQLYLYLKNLIANIPSGTVLKYSNTEKKDYFLCTGNNSGLDINFFIDDFYYEKESYEEFSSYRNNVLKLVLDRVQKLRERLANIELKLSECNNAESYKLYGELITANLYRISDYPQASVTLENYYNDNLPITINLDDTISPSKNAKNFFKKYRKLQNTFSIVSKQKDLALTELSYLDSVVYEISEATTVADIDAIYSEICDNLIYEKSANTVNNNIYNMGIKKNNYKNKANNMPAKFEIDGFTVYVGKNNKQNDYLTCKLAQNSDLWFHTKDIHGSHVVLRPTATPAKLDILNTGVPDSVLYKCASIAAYYSKARMSQNVPVDYTYIKYVKKPNGANPRHGYLYKQ